MLQIVLWKWRQEGARAHYDADHVNSMVLMLRRNLVGYPHRIVCVTDDKNGITECETAHLWSDLHDLPNASGPHLPSCYRRLKLYDRQTQKDIGIDKSDRIMSIDLDTVVTGDLREIVRMPGRYVGWALRGAESEMVFNGSLQIFDSGDLSEIWSEFDPRTSPKLARAAGYRGSDQAWLSFKLCGKPDMVGLEWPLVASYPLQIRVQGVLKRETRLIFFHGSQKPWHPTARFSTPWIDRYYRP